MKVLIIGTLHHKNMIGLKLLLYTTNYEYKFGDINDIVNFDIIYSPSSPIDTSQYSSKIFIFGPHFSVFPNNDLMQINNINNNSIYIQPSNWVCQLWRNFNVEKIITIKTFPFPVEIDKFCPNEQKKKNEVFIYFKRRQPEELQYVKHFLNNKNITYKIFDYVKNYNEEDYLKCLQNAKYGIIIDAHESQGFAIEEALSCNIPLLVWNVSFMSQEYGSDYSNIPCSTIAYWDERCGEYFYKVEEFETTYNEFINKLESYNPREYIMENLSPQKCGERFIELIKIF